MTGPYDDAMVYDVLHGPGTAGEVRALERLARRHRPGSAREDWHWLEPACGTGRLVRQAGRRGIRCTGYDLSAGMLAYGRGRVGIGAPVRLVEGDMRSFVLAARGRATLALCTINTIRHLGSDGALLEHLACVRRSVVRGGVYVVGISMAMPGMEGPTEDVWEGRRGKTRVTQVISYLPPEVRRGRGARVERVISHVRAEGAGRDRVVDSSYWLRTYTRAQWRRVIARSGWEVLEVTDEEGRAIAEPDLGYGLWVLGRG